MAGLLVAAQMTTITARKRRSRIEIWPVVPALLATTVYAGAQFVQLTLFQIGPFVVSLQKVLALCLLPPAILLTRKVIVPRAWLVFYLAQLAALSAAGCVGRSSLSGALSADVALTLGFISALVVVSTLHHQSQRIQSLLSTVWIAAAFISATICILQASGHLPLWTVSSSVASHRMPSFAPGLVRAVGFRYDPNLEAAVLVMGIALAITVIQSNTKAFLIALIIGFGVLATFSRMGVLLTILLFLLLPLVRRRRLGISRGVAMALTIVPLVLLLAIFGSVLSLGRSGESGYIQYRFHETNKGIRTLTSEGPQVLSEQHLTSLESRVLLGYYGLKVFIDHPLVGVGPFSVPQAIQAASDSDNPALNNVAHNSVVQQLATGGIFGLTAVLVYGWVFFSQLGAARRNLMEEPSASFFLLAVVFLFEALVLSLTFTSLYWLPLILGHLSTNRSARGRSNKVIGSSCRPHFTGGRGR